MADSSILEAPRRLSPQELAGLPSNVPPHLVFDLSRFATRNSLDDPFSRTEGVLETLPPLMYDIGRGGPMSHAHWVVTHHEDIREVYQNSDLYSTAGQANFQKLVGESFDMIPLAIDPPEHGKYRILLNPWFSPKAITALEPQMRAIIGELIDGFADQGECDVSYDFGRLYPVRVFMRLMGFPPERLEDFLSWEYAILHNMNDLDRMKWGLTNSIAYVRGFIEEMRANPADNLTSHIVHGQVEGRPLTEDEIIGATYFLWVGGLDTVAATTALMFRRLALEPKLQQTLRDNPASHAEAIEEFLRTQPILNVIRVVKRDHVIHGVQIKAGDRVMGMNMSGNFDPAEFQCPREFRLDRPSNRHFTLAGGPHRCLGSHLARRELRIALTEFLARIPPFRLKPGADRTVTPGLAAAAHLPLVWG